MVEQRTENPCVGSSILPRGKVNVYVGFDYFGKASVSSAEPLSTQPTLSKGYKRPGGIVFLETNH